MAVPTTPMQRRLLACAVALIVLLALTALLYVTRHGLGGWMTPLGLVAPLDLVAIALSMGVGGFVARHGFRGWAVALVVVLGIASAVTAYGYAPPGATGAGRWLLRNTLLQLALSAGIAWASAMLGERWAMRRAARG